MASLALQGGVPVFLGCLASLRPPGTSVALDTQNLVLGLAQALQPPESFHQTLGVTLSRLKLSRFLFSRFICMMLGWGAHAGSAENSVVAHPEVDSRSTGLQNQVPCPAEPSHRWAMILISNANNRCQKFTRSLMWDLGSSRPRGLPQSMERNSKPSSSSNPPLTWDTDGQPMN